MRWQSTGSWVTRRTARVTAGPTVRLGTKCPSMTSTWISAAPPASASLMSAPSRAKSAERIDGAITAPTLTLLVRDRQLDDVAPCDRVTGKGQLPDDRPGTLPLRGDTPYGAVSEPAQGDPFLRVAQRLAGEVGHDPMGRASTVGNEAMH